MSVVKEQRFRIGANKENWREQQWECPLGRLHYFGRLKPDAMTGNMPDDALYRAGVKWRSIVARMRRFLGSPSPFAHGVDFGAKDDAFEHETTAQRYHRLKVGDETEDAESYGEAAARYQAAFRELKSAGYDALRAVNSVVVHEQTPQAEQIPAIRRGLFALALHFGLTGRRKSA